MEYLMTLPTIAGVQSRILTLPDRPPIMLPEAVAEVFGSTSKVLMQGVRRNMDLFPDDFLIELTTEEYLSQWPQTAATAEGSRLKVRQLPQGSRTDLTHYGFTEAGTLMVPHVLRTPEARAAAPVVIRAFRKKAEAIAARIEEMERMLWHCHKQLLDAKPKWNRAFGLIEMGQSDYLIDKRCGWTGVEGQAERDMMRCCGMNPRWREDMTTLLEQNSDLRWKLGREKERSKQLSLGLEG
jgi:hypothetical protein